ncbi:MAG: phosphatase PAP2 family protein [Candidatus Nanohaloarchaeota archaeon QJJ-5]|nr:phosphatase PAP2 family protein [Candidatus Nanohaloarchaeota archaeon QJJ-5]
MNGEQRIVEVLATDASIHLEFLEPLTALGSVPVLGLIILTLYLYGHTEQAYLMGAGSVITGLTALLLKEIIMRPRPSVAYREVLTSSFPSAHTALAFVNAVLLAWFYPRLRGWFILLATGVGFSRIALGVHYPSDVLAGLCIGTVVGWLVWQNASQILSVLRVFDRVRERLPVTE